MATYTKKEFEEATKIHDLYIEETLALSNFFPKKEITKRTISKKDFLKAKTILRAYIKEEVTSRNPQIKLL